jgi:hypothetical protein
MKLIRPCIAATVFGIAPWAVAQTDSHHFMQIEQVIAGVGGDTSAQAIQLRMRFSSQNFVNGSSIVAFDAAGLNPITIVAFNRTLTNGTAGDRVLVATSAFSNFTNPPAVADFTMTNPIPLSYLNAGRVVFQTGPTVWWSLAWGGANYTGSNLGSTTNDLDGNFGPPFGSPLPSSGVESLIFPGGANALSTTNLADYRLTTAAAVFTNNARNSFTVEAPCYPDCDLSTGQGVLDIFDFLCFQNLFATNDPYACECDPSTGPGICDIFDFLCFQNAFAAGCP